MEFNKMVFSFKEKFKGNLIIAFIDKKNKLISKEHLLFFNNCQDKDKSLLVNFEENKIDVTIKESNINSKTVKILFFFVNCEASNEVDINLYKKKKQVKKTTQQIKFENSSCFQIYKNKEGYKDSYKNLSIEGDVRYIIKHYGQ